MVQSNTLQKSIHTNFVASQEKCANQNARILLRVFGRPRGKARERTSRLTWKRKNSTVNTRGAAKNTNGNWRRNKTQIARRENQVGAAVAKERSCGDMFWDGVVKNHTRHAQYFYF